MSVTAVEIPTALYLLFGCKKEMMRMYKISPIVFILGARFSCNVAHVFQLGNKLIWI